MASRFALKLSLSLRQTKVDVMRTEKNSIGSDYDCLSYEVDLASRPAIHPVTHCCRH